MDTLGYMRGSNFSRGIGGWVRRVAALVWLLLGVGGAEEGLDPSIFDGSEGEKGVEGLPTPGSMGGEGEAAVKGEGEEKGPVLPPSAGGAAEEVPEEGGTDGGAEEQGPVVPPSAGGAAEEIPEEGGMDGGEEGGRAGETFRPSERIPPEQAVDLPWDM